MKLRSVGIPFFLLIIIFLFLSCTVKKENELRFGLMSEPATFDPLNPANTADGRFVLFNVFEGLFKCDQSGNMIAALAKEDYYTSPDGLLYVFELKDNLFFSDGSPVLAGDVVFSLNEAKNAGFTDTLNIISVKKNEITYPDFLPYLFPPHYFLCTKTRTPCAKT